MNFTFVVLTYNHEDFIFEHLESIKFQIETFGQNMLFQLVVADDGSSDKNLAFVKSWIAVNSTLFYEVKVIEDGVNRGTCVNYTKTWEYIKGDYCKITAGDDVYSCTNLFANLGALDSYEIMSGLPLLLLDGQILPSKSEIFHIIATDVLYRNLDFSYRLRRIGTINAPNIFLSKKIFANSSVAQFIRRFSVTEDLPLYIALCREYYPLRFVQCSQINVYYRRTNTSTYIVKHTQFNTDKVELYENLLGTSPNLFEAVLLRNRLFCFKLKSSFLKKLFNLNYYLYAVLLLVNFFTIFRQFVSVNRDIQLHQRHADLIKDRATEMRKKCDQVDHNLDWRFGVRL
jgi:glycosyltransferase involved in cell wall biosynthesis